MPKKEEKKAIAVCGLNYPVKGQKHECRVEPGQVIEHLSAKEIDELIEQGYATWEGE